MGQAYREQGNSPERSSLRDETCNRSRWATALKAAHASPLGCLLPRTGLTEPARLYVCALSLAPRSKLALLLEGELYDS